MMRTIAFLLLILVAKPTEAREAQLAPPTDAAVEANSPVPPQREMWHITGNYDTLPCMSIQQTKTLKDVREDGAENLVKEADIFHENTKAFFQKHKKFICPPLLERQTASAEKPVVAPVGTVNAFEEILIVHPWQMDIMKGTAKDEIWKVNFDSENGVGHGKTKVLKNEFTLVPLMPREKHKSPFLVHSMKIPGHEKELVRVCYPAEMRKTCNPYAKQELPKPPEN